MDSIEKMQSKRAQLQARIDNINDMINEAREIEKAAAGAIRMEAPDDFQDALGKQEMPTATDEAPPDPTPEEIFANEVANVAAEVVDESRYELAKMTYRLAEKMNSLSVLMKRLHEDIQFCHKRGSDVNFLGDRKQVRELLDDLGHRNGVGY